MELVHAGYLYTLALMAMTFVGFTAIVMILRQGLGAPLSRFDTMVTRFFMVWGFLIAYGAMLPPLLYAFFLPPSLTWTISSAVVGGMLLLLSFGYPLLRARATGETAPPFVFGQSVVGILISLILVINAIELISIEIGSAIYLAVLTFTLVQASAGFIVTINVMLQQQPRR